MHALCKFHMQPGACRARQCHSGRPERSLCAQMRRRVTGRRKRKLFRRVRRMNLDELLGHTTGRLAYIGPSTAMPVQLEGLPRQTLCLHCKTLSTLHLLPDHRVRSLVSDDYGPHPPERATPPHPRQSSCRRVEGRREGWGRGWIGWDEEIDDDAGDLG